MKPLRVATAAIVLCAAGAPATAQYMELGAGVPLSPAALEATLASNARAALELGIPTLEDFLRGAPLGAAPASAVGGTISAIVIPALFADSPPDAPVAADELRRILFDGPYTPGTVTDFYREASRGQVELTGAVADWVRTSVTIAGAAGELEGHGWVGPELWRHVREALALADLGLDYGAYDNDGPDGVPNSGDDDGIVDAVIILEPAITGACGGPGIWPHFGAVRDAAGRAPYVANETTPAGRPISIPVYVLAGAMDCTGTEPEGPGVVAHEMGHRLGLPDYYVPVIGISHHQRHWLLGCFDLMAGGAWGCGTGPQAPAFGPARLSPYSRARLGWLEYEDVPLGSEGDVTLVPSAEATTALRIPLASGRDEYFLAEYRPATGFDEGLPAGGVVVYHLDLSLQRVTFPPDTVPLYRYYVVEADGDDALRKLEGDGGNRGAQGDVYGLGVARFDDTTTPRAWDHLGNGSGVVLSDIVVDRDAALATLHVVNRPAFGVTPLVTPQVITATDGYEARVLAWNPSGAITATVVGGLPGGLDVRVAGDTVIVWGRPLDVGSFDPLIVVSDAGGRTHRTGLPVTVRDAHVAHEAFAAMLASPDGDALPAIVRTYLDRSGNRNGQLDVGDLRAYLQRTRALPN